MEKREIETISTRIVYKNRWMRVREDRIKRSDGSLGIYGIVEKADYVVIVPREKDTLVLVEQYRYPVGERCLEFPQGSREDEHIVPIELAKAELKEETGYAARHLEHVGFIYQSYGHSNQGFHIYFATGLEEGTQALEAEEQGLMVRHFSIKEVEAMIIEGTIKDNATISAFGLLKMKGILGSFESGN